VLVARRRFPDLLALGGDSGARALLESLGPRLVLVAASGSGVLFDVDRPSDLARPSPRTGSPGPTSGSET
jgi:molybdenum cofactor cytidylyltransferase